MIPFTVCLVFYDGNSHTQMVFHVFATAARTAYNVAVNDIEKKVDEADKEGKIYDPGCEQGSWIIEGHHQVANYHGNIYKLGCPE